MSRTIDPEGFGFLVTDIARLMRADMDRRIAASGLDLTPGEARVLVHAARAGQVRQTVLAARIGVEAMTVSGYVDRLEAHGLIERLPDPTDRRAKLVALTEAADAILDQVVVLGQETRESASQGIAPQDWDRVLAALKIIRSNFSDARIEARSAAE